ncbi:ectoine/hydroxyectoine ABC transporter substrate-binding protein EhuB [Alkalibacter rhizosphaerae]|uniref:Ectoine/hydroxyectoine ABC transporter substrate-binding protein EhuB n=1 Tax=Alkalibacter rhizosphaerae TaxID=2815577 RepID=A0A974XET7_9FIRM|nr:ectoine/hydroxyectoine ABC transporter substrate-binding protein EhuB [Alkalibacter rhizosphaerae]QSX08441.1 ectoine/hydroxyectoine ABC transporter substrate-binding protein EhuB [Alkalibacter rhizosphaerae]
MKKKKTTRKWIIAGIILTMLVAVSGCGTTGNETTLDKALREGYVTVGFHNEDPYAYENSEGELTGQAVEVARAVLKNMGIDEMRGVLTEFGSLIPGLNAERFDIITAGMYITPERGEQVLFADPDFSVGEALAVQSGNPLDIQSYEDIVNHETAKVVVLSGVIENDYLLKSGMPQERIVNVPDVASAISALKTGRADVWNATSPTIDGALKSANDPDLERVEDFTQPIIEGKSAVGYGAAAFRKGDQDFVDAFNEELAKIKESGELLEIIEPFGFTENELPGDVMAEDLLNEK